MAPASQRKPGIGRAEATQAMPATIKAKEVVSQPLSSTMVRPIASAATAPVMKMAIADAEPGRGSRRLM